MSRLERHSGTIRCLEHDFIVRETAQARQIRNMRNSNSHKCHIAGIDINMTSAVNILLLQTHVRLDDADPSSLVLTGPAAAITRCPRKHVLLHNEAL